MNTEKNLEKNLKTIAKSSIFVFVSILLSKLLAYAYRVVIARNFGPEGYGLFILVLAAFSFFAFISTLGFSEGILRFIPQLNARGKINEIKFLLKKITNIYFFTGILSSLILIFFSDFIAINIFHDYSLSPLIKLISIGLTFNLFTLILFSILRSFEKIKEFSFAVNILQNFLNLAILILFISLGFGKQTKIIIFAYLLGILLTFIFTLFLARHAIPKLFKKGLQKEYPALGKKFTNYSIPLLFSGMTSMVLYWTDTFLLGFYKSSFEVGIYNAAVPIALLITIIPSIFLQLFSPLINKEYSKKNYKVIEQLSKQVTKWVFMLGLPIFILIFFFPGAALNILFGAKYISGKTALQFLLIGSFVSSMFMVSTTLINMLGKSKIILYNNLFILLINLILNFILIPMPSIMSLNNSNGLIGASLSTMISSLLLNLILIIQTKKYLKIILLKRKMVTIGLVSIIPTILIFYVIKIIKINLVTIFIISEFFLLVYVFLITISSSLDKNDWMVIKSCYNKFRKTKKPI